MNRAGLAMRSAQLVPARGVRRQYSVASHNAPTAACDNSGSVGDASMLHIELC